MRRGLVRLILPLLSIVFVASACADGENFTLEIQNQAPKLFPAGQPPGRNLLPANAAEPSVGGWVDQGNATLSDARLARTGNGSLRVDVRTGARLLDDSGSSAIATKVGPAGIETVAGIASEGRIWVQSLGSGHRARCELRYYDGQDVIETAYGPLVSIKAGSWTGIECEAVAPLGSETMALRVLVTNGDKGGAYFVDSAHLAHVALKTPNMLSNNANEGLAGAWVEHGSAEAATSSQAFKGYASLKVTTGATIGGTALPRVTTGVGDRGVDVKPGTDSLGSVYVKPASGGHEARCEVSYYRNNQLIKIVPTPARAVDPGKWNRVWCIGRAPGGAETLSVGVVLTDAKPGDVFYVDYAYLVNVTLLAQDDPEPTTTDDGSADDRSNNDATTHNGADHNGSAADGRLSECVEHRYSWGWSVAV